MFAANKIMTSVASTSKNNIFLFKIEKNGTAQFNILINITIPCAYNYFKRIINYLSQLQELRQKE